MTNRQTTHRRFALALLLAALALGVFAVGAEGRNAYVTNFGEASVSVFNTVDNLPIGGITVGAEPGGVAITPDGRLAYVANSGAESVSVIDTATNQVVVPGIKVGKSPEAIAITPDGANAWVTNAGAESVSVIDTGTNQVVVPEIKVGNVPIAIAITPDKRFAYVANEFSGTISVINLATNQPLNKTIAVGGFPDAVAISPDGSHAYVARAEAASVAVIDTTTNQVVVPAIGVGPFPKDIAITPDGKFAYVTDSNSEGVSVVNLTTNQVEIPELKVGNHPAGIAITPSGSRAYVVNQLEKSVSVIKTSTNQVLGEEVAVAKVPVDIAISPDQPPVASFEAVSAPAGMPVTLDVSASRDPDGQISTYDWDFGDGQATTLTSPQVTHTYAHPGTYQVKLRLTDGEGCSDSLRFTGQTALCNGSALATKTVSVAVTAPARETGPQSTPSSGFSFGKLVLNRKRGTAKLSVLVSGPGSLLLTGRGTKRARRIARAAGVVKLSITPIGKAKRALAKGGKLRLRARVTYTPSNGAAETKTKAVRLKRTAR